MGPARPKLSLAALVLAGTAAFALAGHFAATRFIHDQQARQLDELTEVVLRRSEFAVDFAAASLDDLAGRGLASCDPVSLQAVRLHVYQRSAVKDVRIVNPDGSVICSAYSETLEFDKGWVGRADMLGSHDSRLLLFRVEELLVALAKDFHMTVIAEGIESQEQVRALISCGVEEGQGYLVAPPLPFAKFNELLALRRAAIAVAAPAGNAALVA